MKKQKRYYDRSVLGLELEMKNLDKMKENVAILINEEQQFKNEIQFPLNSDLNTLVVLNQELDHSFFLIFDIRRN
jgi:hypothetical protein